MHHTIPHGLALGWLIAELIRQLSSPNEVLYQSFLSYIVGEALTTLEFIRSNLLFMEANSKAR